MARSSAYTPPVQLPRRDSPSLSRSTASRDPAPTSPTAQSKQRAHPRKRSHSQAHAQPDHLAHLAGAVDETQVVSPRITQEDRDKVRVVVER